MFGRSFNQAVAKEAKVLGYDALELDAEPCWLIVMDTSKLRVVPRTILRIVRAWTKKARSCNPLATS